MHPLLFHILSRSIERERNFFARVRLALKLWKVWWGAYGKSRRVSKRSGAG